MHFWTDTYYQMGVFFFFSISERGQNRDGQVLGCRDGGVATSKSVLKVRICGLEHCPVTNGHAGDRFLDVLFSFLFAIFSEPHSYRSYQTHPYFWNSNLYE